MFVMRGFYDIATARKSRFFIKLKDGKADDGSRIYLVGFSNDKNVNPTEYFGLSEPLPKSSGHEFMAVQDFGRIYEGKQ